MPHDPAAASLDFDTIYQTHAAYVLNVVTRIVGPEAAPDVAQLAWLRVSRALGGYRGDAQLRTWLTPIAKHMAIDYLRRNDRVVRRGTAVDLDQAEHLPAAGPTPFEHVHERQQQALVDRALRQLPSADQALILAKFAGYSLEERQVLFGITHLGTLKSRTHRAIEKLAHLLRTQYGEKTSAH